MESKRVKSEKLVSERFGALAELANAVGSTLSESIVEVAESVADTFARGGRVFICGNGGSAADAQHLAAEYIVRFGKDRRALPAIALTTDSSVLTAAGNDLGFEAVFARQLQALGQPGDLLLLHSTSGSSQNLIEAVKTASQQGVHTVALLAKGGGVLLSMVDLALVVPTNDTARAQEVQLAIGHVICELVEARLGGELGAQ